jgi:hypothetical protein
MRAISVAVIVLAVVMVLVTGIAAGLVYSNLPE